MKHSPLQLVRYLVTDVACTADPKFDPQKEIVGAMEQFSIESKASPFENPKNDPAHPWSVELTVSQKVKEGQNIPYEFRIALVGVFACRNEAPVDERETRFVRVNGSSMLYGIAREHIRALTAAGPWGAIILPTMSFYDNKELPKKEEAPAQKAE
jgi:preprotein translocase subunit SecB